MTLFPYKHKPIIKANNPLMNRMVIRLGMLLFVAMSVVGTASATIDTANITDAISVLGTVGAGFIDVLKVIFVDNLSTIILLALIGVVLMLFAGFARMILKFAFSMIGNVGQGLHERYGRK